MVLRPCSRSAPETVRWRVYSVLSRCRSPFQEPLVIIENSVLSATFSSTFLTWQSCTVLETAGVGALDRLLELLNAPLRTSAKSTKAKSEANGARGAGRKVLLEEPQCDPPQGKIIWVRDVVCTLRVYWSHLSLFCLEIIGGSASALSIASRAFYTASLASDKSSSPPSCRCLIFDASQVPLFIDSLASIETQ